MEKQTPEQVVNDLENLTQELAGLYSNTGDSTYPVSASHRQSLRSTARLTPGERTAASFVATQGNAASISARRGLTPTTGAREAHQSSGVSTGRIEASDHPMPLSMDDCQHGNLARQWTIPVDCLHNWPKGHLVHLWIIHHGGPHGNLASMSMICQNGNHVSPSVIFILVPILWEGGQGMIWSHPLLFGGISPPDDRGIAKSPIAKTLMILPCDDQGPALAIEHMFARALVHGRKLLGRKSCDRQKHGSQPKCCQNSTS
jgi:hypothetical protein